ncbi:hypothetical protein C8R45DRAFT_1101947 [Mycena sanguinolenta]|nr:hypothetical protein C8R45DRAFT_1101947 [Mycena sanguinolenta]
MSVQELRARVAAIDCEIELQKTMLKKLEGDKILVLRCRARSRARHVNERRRDRRSLPTVSSYTPSRPACVILPRFTLIICIPFLALPSSSIYTLLHWFPVLSLSYIQYYSTYPLCPPCSELVIRHSAFVVAEVASVHASLSFSLVVFIVSFSLTWPNVTFWSPPRGVSTLVSDLLPPIYTRDPFPSATTDTSVSPASHFVYRSRTNASAHVSPPSTPTPSRFVLARRSVAFVYASSPPHPRFVRAYASASPRPRPRFASFIAYAPTHPHPLRLRFVHVSRPRTRPRSSPGYSSSLTLTTPSTLRHRSIF